MLDIIHYPLFLLSVFIFAVTPGPDIAYVLGQSLANGRKAGILSALGVMLGSSVHAIAGTVGLGAIIAASPTLFTVIKYLGALYLAFLGAKMILGTLRKRGQTADDNEEVVIQKAAAKSILIRGFITTLTNPKVLLFFIAFFPQFIAAGGSYYAESFLLLGATYALLGFCTDTTLALIAGTLAARISGSPKAHYWIDRLVGTTFIALGLRLASVAR
ncbi:MULTISPECIES: LysE family translocator [Morganella]|uniref:LysE family translocator n=1 Tax=Morganella TaxID=581 RepID=UPI00339BCAF9